MTIDIDIYIIGITIKFLNEPSGLLGNFKLNLGKIASEYLTLRKKKIVQKYFFKFVQSRLMG